MRAWVQSAFGGPEVRRLEQVDPPRLRPDEALVRVAAVALNRLDLLQREAPVVPTFQLPHIAGMDIVGTVAESGGSPSAMEVGTVVLVDPVVTCERCDFCLADLPMYCRHLRTIGSSRPGGLAELVAVPTRNLHRLDVRADDLVALAAFASVPVASVTAWHALHGAGSIREGETVVVPGAGSGLGTAGVQLAKQAGCRTVSLIGAAGKRKAAERMGADLVVDRRSTDWVAAVREFTQGRGADLVWDHVGGVFLQQAIDATRVGGRVVLSGTTAGGTSTIANTSVFHWGRTLVGHGGYSRPEMAATIDAYVRGAIQPVVDSVWAFEELQAAEARLESGDFFGKIVVMGSDLPTPAASW